jgi:hypothetical protein
MYSIIIWLINKDGQTCRWLSIDTSLEKWCRCCLLYRSAQLCMMLTSMYMAHQFNICHRRNLVLCVSLIEFIRSSLGYDSVAGRIYDITHYIGSTWNRIGRELYVVPHLIVLFVRSEKKWKTTTHLSRPCRLSFQFPFLSAYSIIQAQFSRLMNMKISTRIANETELQRNTTAQPKVNCSRWRIWINCCLLMAFSPAG